MKYSHAWGGHFRTIGILVLLAILIDSGCTSKCTVMNDYVYFEPVYTSFEELRASVVPVDPRPMNSAGKIYFKDDYLFINEVGKGVHVIDNSDPAAPLPVSFINIPGNFDLAIRGSVLYADSYTDLVAIDISTPGSEKEIGRAPNLFDQSSRLGVVSSPSLGVVTSWMEVAPVSIEEEDCDVALQPWGGRWYRGGALVSADMSGSFRSLSAQGSLSAPAGQNSTGVGGSMARFTISAEYLYALDGANLNVVQIADPLQMTLKNDLTINWDIETIFPYDGKLFIGSQSGMHVYDLQDPESPSKITTFWHMRSCDPVVVEGNYAYVTLRSGNTCNGVINRLEVIDITLISAPRLVKAYPMTNPHGLGIDSNTLFICDGSDGLKVFDATDKLKVTENLLAHYKDLQAYDIIPFGNVAMVIGEDGLFQYDYSDVKNIRLLSQLPLTEAE